MATFAQVQISKLQDCDTIQNTESIKLPSVTVAIPAYNESHTIERVVRHFINTSYPNIIEILIADGGSTDGTQDIIDKIAGEDSRVRLIHNPLKIQSAGLNILFLEAKGDIFLRADAHSDYASNYVECCVEALLKSQASNVGGAQRFVAKNSFQAGVALAARSLLGNGGAKYRNPNYNGYADTVYLGCFWRDKLIEVAQIFQPENGDMANLFDTTQITNQDAELNQRLLAKNSNAIYISSDIEVWYYPRDNWKSLWNQYFKYGRGRYLTSTKHNNRMQIRGKLPFITISLAILLTLISFFFQPIRLPVAMMFFIAMVTPFIESLRISLKYIMKFDSDIWRNDNKQVPSLLTCWFLCSISLITLPIAHFCGYSFQLYRHKIIGINGW